ncbi:MAG: Isopentenyldiphosphate isomerase [Candidatus Nanosalina sp. J07AB43]|nr:MAG: Isopentenyldiphosphate isomerase [Candidatus Nanosalina sp. J07AB43]
MTSFLPEVDSGKVSGWVEKKEAHRGEPVLHDANTCFIVKGDKLLLGRRSTGDREGIGSKRVGAGQWEGVSTHLHRDDVRRYGIDPDNLKMVNDNISDLNIVSAVERIEYELDSKIFPQLSEKLDRDSLSSVVNDIRSYLDLTSLGTFRYLMDRDVDGKWSEKELCRCFMIRCDINPSTTEEVMDYKWKPLSELESSHMRSSDRFPTWASRAFEKLETSSEVSLD